MDLTTYLKSRINLLKRLQARQPMLFAHIADLLIQLGKYKQAMNILNKGLYQFPEYATGWVVKGNLHLALHQDDRACESFRRALETDPHIPYAHDRCAEYARENGDIDTFYRHLQDMAYLDTLDGNIQTMMQTVLLRKIAVENGLFTWTEVERLMPGTLRQTLLKHNLIPSSLERTSVRWTVKSQDLTPDEADTTETETGTLKDENDPYASAPTEIELLDEDKTPLLESAPQEDFELEDINSYLESVPREALGDGSDWEGGIPTPPKSFSTAKTEWTQAEQDTHTRVDWAETVSPKSKSPLIEVDPESEFEKAPDSGEEPDSDTADLSYETFDERYSDNVDEPSQEGTGSRQAQLDDEAGFEPERHPWSDMKQLVEEEPEPEDTEADFPEIPDEASSVKQDDAMDETPPAPTPIRVKPDAGMGYFRKKPAAKAAPQEPELSVTPPDMHKLSREQPLVERGKADITGDSTAGPEPAKPEFVREPPVIERSAPGGMYYDDEPVKLGDFEGTSTAKPPARAEPIPSRKQTLINMLKEAASDKDKPAADHHLPEPPAETTDAELPAESSPDINKPPLAEIIVKPDEGVAGEEVDSEQTAESADQVAKTLRDIDPTAKSRLAAVAREVTGEKSVPAPKGDAPDNKGGGTTKIATKTLAELYASQGEWEKAIDVYEELLRRFPNNEAYRQRVKELKARGESRTPK